VGQPSDESGPNDASSEDAVERVTGDFLSRYGPWAVVTGGSEGVGRSWSEALAARGLNLVLVARREAVLRDAARELERHGAEVRMVCADVTNPDVFDRLDAATSDIEIGLVIHNVGSWQREHGWFLDDPIDVSLKTIEVNCTVPTRLAHAYGRAMCERGRGGFVFVGSLAGIAGQPLEATYSAAKAFAQHLAEALWSEFAHHGVHVVYVPLGGTRTPALEVAGIVDTAGLPTGDDVVADAITHFGDGPVYVPIEANRRFFERVTALDRRAAAETMARLAYRTIGEPTVS
jgi:short-subunit dehydrogenase